MSDTVTESQQAPAGRSKDRPSPFFEAAQVSSVGVEMAVATLLGWAGGYWLDNKFETGPWLMLVGLLFGVAAGFNGLIRTAHKINARQQTPGEHTPVRETATAAGTSSSKAKVY